MRKRSTPNVFSLAFLDAMFCGFGAVVLLYMIINHDTVSRRQDLQQELDAETERLQQAVLTQTKHLVELQNSLQRTQHEQVTTEGLAREVLRQTRERQEQLAEHQQDTLASREHVNALKADLRSLEEQAARLKAATPSPGEEGERLRAFPGEGDRQYLTGLKMGGERILILVDSSASMLAETIVNVIRLRNLPTRRRLLAEKWRRAVATVDWLSTQIPPRSRFQVYAFNDTARAVLKDTDKTWLQASDVQVLDRAVEALRKTAPQGGTNLYRAFIAIAEMQPLPDNVFLLTDSLPTQGKGQIQKGKVSGKRRARLFEQAVEALPPQVPLNIILFPMEGDPFAASAFWKLAVYTRGSFINPSHDWP
jgi:hypothetical protein